MGHTNNRTFTSIPFDMFRRMLKYKAEQNGIRYIEQEESYTSKASFLDNDFIPVYGEDVNVAFSGTRRKRLYKTADGTIINADLNGSANIARKAIPDVFAKGIAPDFTNVKIFKHPDMDLIAKNRENQKRNPYGVTLCE